MDDNIFDEDDALDYVIYEDCEKNTKQGSGGCLSIFIILLFPFAGVSIVGNYLYC